MSEWIAYTELHPISPGTERMLAQIAAVTFGNKDVGEADFWIRKKPPQKQVDAMSSFHDVLRARAAQNKGKT